MGWYKHHREKHVGICDPTQLRIKPQCPPLVELPGIPCALVRKAPKPMRFMPLLLQMPPARNCIRMRPPSSEAVQIPMLQHIKRSHHASLLSGDELATVRNLPFEALEPIRQLSVPLVQRTSLQKSKCAMTCLAQAMAV